MKRLFTTCLLLWPILGTAAPVQVQTGWHADFTRVVLIVPRDSTWKLGRNETGYTLSLPVEDGFDTSRFFELIPRERIANVDQDVTLGELYLDVACDCHITATQDSPSILVLDIRDGPAPDDALYEAAFAGSEPEETLPEDAPQETTLEDPYTVPRSLFLPLVNDITPDVQPFSPDNRQNPSPVTQGQSQAETSLPQEQSAETINDLASLERSITESLGRALSQGLLETNLDGASENTPADIRIALDGSASPGISASTGIDKAAVPDDPFVPMSQDGTECLDSKHFAIQDWGDERPFAAQISEKRGLTVNNAGGFDQAAVTSLARNYLFFGFGREAVQTIEMDGLMSQERQIISVLAKLIDNEPLETELFAQQVSCDTSVALWALLSPSQGGRDAQVNRPAVLRAFKLLPQALQLHLAPRLSTRFLEIGDNDSAIEVLGAVEARPDASLEVELAQNGLSRALGEQEQAVAQIVEIVESDVRITPEVMITMFEDAIENDLMISQDDLLLADALRFENASLAISAELADAQIRAYLQNSQFSEADALLQQSVNELEASKINELENLFASKATAKMQDHAFLKFAFESNHDTLIASNQNAIARRVLGLGFPDLASDILNAQAEGADAEERRYLLAEAAFAAGDIGRTLALLEGASTERAAILQQAVSDFSTEGGIAPLAYTNGSPETDQWRRGEWANLQSVDDPLLQAASIAVLESVDADIGGETPLANSRALLDQAEEARSVVNALLQRFSSPEEF